MHINKHTDMDLSALPREVQYSVLGFVGWHHADPLELASAVRSFKRRHTIVHDMGDLPCSYYRYIIPRWCDSCGEYREFPCVKCGICGNIRYRLVGWR